MSRIENVTALPIRQMVHPLQLAMGGSIALCGVALMLAQGLTLI